MGSRLVQWVICMLFILTCGMLSAQEAALKADRVYKLDKTFIEVKIDEVNSTDIIYRKTDDLKGPLYGISRKDVWKIIWNNGDLEEINTLIAPVKNPVSPTTLLVKRKVQPLIFGDKKGLFFGAKLGAGLSTVAQSSFLMKDPSMTYHAGLAVGYRKNAFCFKLEALYNHLGYNVVVSDNLSSTVSAIHGSQHELWVPLTVTASKKFKKIRLGLAAGAYSTFQLGAGSLKTDYREKTSSKTINCSSCSAEKIGLGVLGGVSAQFLESSKRAFFAEARWYQNLKDNKDFQTGKTPVSANLGTISVGMLFHFPNK